MSITGICDCGLVTIEIEELPDRINACPCSYCRKIGARWGYFKTGKVTITGKTLPYRRASRTLEFHRCLECGVFTHWIAPGGEVPYMGVNTVTFADDKLAGIPVVVEP